MAGAFTRLDIMIEGIRFVDQGGFSEVMDRFGNFLWHQFGVQLMEGSPCYRDPPPPPRTGFYDPRRHVPPIAKRPRSVNWRKTLGLHPHAPVGVREIEHAFRVLVKKLRPDRIDHDTNNRRRDRWERVVAAREAALREVE